MWLLRWYSVDVDGSHLVRAAVNILRCLDFTRKMLPNFLTYLIFSPCTYIMLLLLLLSRFSHVRLCPTPQMAAHQAPPSLGFSRQEHGVGCHFLLQCMKVKSESEVAQSCPTLSDPMDCSLPGSSVHGIFQARVLEWGAIAFSHIYVGLTKKFT